MPARVRRKSGAPSSASRRCRRAVSEGWLRCRSAAARLSERCSAMATKPSRRPITAGTIGIVDAGDLQDRLDGCERPSYRRPMANAAHDADAPTTSDLDAAVRREAEELARQWAEDP